ncbi:hypothetical protein ACF1BQ_020745 [Bradyrhizobium sp. RDT10]
MVIAVVTMGVMQMTIDQIVRVVAVRDSLVATARPVTVRSVVSTATMIWRATVWIRGAYRKRVLVHMILVWVMQMSIMKIVDVAIVTNSDVAAAGSVLMRVIGVNRMIVRGHGFSFPYERCVGLNERRDRWRSG